MKHTYLKLPLLFLIVFLSGCLYPDSERAENQIPYEDQLRNVQEAVDQYQEETNGLVPILTKDSDTPIFEKYIIDFSLLKERNILSEIPGNAFEKGGPYLYSLITPDEDPRVKLIDLRITEQLRNINLRINAYRNEHLYPPFGDVIQDGIYTIDYEKIGLESPPTVESPYSKNQLPIIMNTEGKIFVDYRMDLNDALQKYDHHYSEGDDIRYILADHTPFVPAYSIEYTIQDDEPIFLVK